MEENKKLKYVGPSFNKVVLSSGERIAATCTPSGGWYRQNAGEALPCYFDQGGTQEVQGS
jgi:hypothetical protein